MLRFSTSCSQRDHSTNMHCRQRRGNFLVTGSKESRVEVELMYRPASTINRASISGDISSDSSSSGLEDGSILFAKVLVVGCRVDVKDHLRGAEVIHERWDRRHLFLHDGLRRVVHQFGIIIEGVFFDVR